MAAAEMKAQWLSSKWRLKMAAAKMKISEENGIEKLS